jgi:hypothetical protein
MKKLKCQNCNKIGANIKEYSFQIFNSGVLNESEYLSLCNECYKKILNDMTELLI